MSSRSPWSSEARYRLAAALVLALLAARCLQAAWVLSPTYDEGLHLLDGYNWLLDGRVQDERNPPVGKGILALPLLVTQPERPGDVDPLSRVESLFDRAAEFATPGNEQCRQRLFIGRCMAVLMLVLLCLLVTHWARALGGRAAGLAALVLISTEPNLLAHGMLTTLDLPATLGVTLTLYLWWRLQRKPTWLGAVFCGWGLAMALGSKLSTLALIPLLVFLLLIWVRGLKREAGDGQTWTPNKACLALGLVFVTAGFVLWMVYGFQTGPIYIPPEGARGFGRTGFYERMIPFGFLLPRETHWWIINHLPVPAPSLWRGTATVLDQVEAGRDAFLCGWVSPKGWLYFYILVAAWKFTVPMWLLGLLVAGWSRLQWKHASDGWVLLLGAGWFFAVASVSHFQLGVRHILPVLPALCVVLALGTVRLIERGGMIRRLTIFVLLLAPLPGALIHPGYLSFMNLLAGGPAEGYRLLVDSNYDWGQDVQRGLRYIDAHPDEAVYVELFANIADGQLGLVGERGEHEVRPYGSSNAVVGQLGLAGKRIERTIDRQPAPGTYLISATALQGMGTRGLPGPHPWFLLREPDGRLGWSILVYRVP